MTVADRIKEQREKLGMSQEELAHKLGLKSRSSITRIEKSGDEISLKDVERISEALNCSPLYLMGWEDETLNRLRIYAQEIPKKLRAYEPGFNYKAKSKKQIQQEEKISKFANLYSQLGDDEQGLVDKMLITLTRKQ